METLDTLDGLSQLYRIKETKQLKEALPITRELNLGNGASGLSSVHVSSMYT